MKNIFGFFKSVTFLKHLGIALVSLLLIIWLVFKWLDYYTHHGETVMVPDFKGSKIANLDQVISGKRLKYLVIDSVYDTKQEKGIVIKQEPDAGTRVKQDRTIYLSVSASMPPRIAMPHLEDRSLRQAVALLETYGLKLSKPVKRKPDVCNGCVLKQEYKGKPIREGTLIERGSEITLTIGEGHGGGERVGIPNLIGLTWREAIQKLNENNLSDGAAIFDKKQIHPDSATAIVYRQSPAPGTDREITIGSAIDLYLTNDKSKIKGRDTIPH